MCVLTFIPHADGQFTLTHNRDEHVLRPAAWPPAAWFPEKTTAIFPKDPQGGGTWFALHDDWILCLLNGGFEKHVRKPPYSGSRGLVILQFLERPDFAVFEKKFDPTGLEPFTLVAFDLKNRALHQLVWDERMLHIRGLAADESHIWSSATLYDSRVRAARRRVFERFIQQKPTATQALDFHRLHSENDLGDSFFVNINDQICTVAITQASGRHGQMRLNYEAFSGQPALFV